MGDDAIKNKVRKKSFTRGWIRYRTPGLIYIGGQGYQPTQNEDSADSRAKRVSVRSREKVSGVPGGNES